jgi:hypothetical protein
LVFFSKKKYAISHEELQLTIIHFAPVAKPLAQEIPPSTEFLTLAISFVQAMIQENSQY